MCKVLKCLLCFMFFGLLNQGYSQTKKIKIGVFRVDATPPIGSPVLNTYARSIQDSLSARGIVLLSDEKPIVLCAVDWVGIANEGMEVWRKRLAQAADTDVDRVSVHVIHQHDAPRCDFTTEKILDQYGLGGSRFDTVFLHNTIENAAKAVSKAKENAKTISHIGFGEARVDKVASNRRILGKDGKVEIWRPSRTKDEKAIQAPEGVIDPWLKSLTFWQGKTPLAVMTFYATHPQSHYGKGDVSCEFIGIARSVRENVLNDLPHIHFNGAGGNIAAGKYNDGSPKMRPILAQRIEKAMKEAYENSERNRVKSKDLVWKTTEVEFALREGMDDKRLIHYLESDTISDLKKYYLARHLAWMQRISEKNYPSISALHIHDISLLLLPGELFVEYQLMAQDMFPNQQVCTAAYRELGMFYIGTEIAYGQGGYEASEGKSLVSTKSESIIMDGIRKVLDRKN